MPATSAEPPVVWVVDDSPLDAERARRVLAGGYRLEVFNDGSSMLEHLAASPAPDVLVLDWVMPGVSGIEVCRFLRARESDLPRLAILLLTTQTQTEQIVEGLAAGANDYLVKPYADPELQARVAALVRWNRLLDRAQRAEASVRELLEQAPDAFLGLDHRRRIIYANAEAQRALGRPAPDLLGRALGEVLPALERTDLESVGDAAVRSLPDVEIGGQTFEPTIRWFPSAVTSGVTVGLRNVTERRRREARRLDFYSMVAHDLRSPLGSMLMRTDLMLKGTRGPLSPALHADLRKMETGIESLVALINDFLDFARMEGSSQEIERARVGLAPLIAEVLDDFKPLIDSADLQIRAPGEVRDAVVLGDRRRLQQVLTNLVANAIKFSPKGGTVTVDVIASEAWCEVAVEDDGPGIAASVLPTLFQRYARAPSTKHHAGTGLGLMIVREIIEAHGGSVGVDNRDSPGSRFWFRLPRPDRRLATEGSAAPAA